jgi:hypothetical protein
MDGEAQLEFQLKIGASGRSLEFYQLSIELAPLTSELPQ